MRHFSAGKRSIGTRRKRGQAFVIALALVFFLSLLVVATQIQVITQLSESRSERDYERALQMAEAGLNAYVNRLSQGPANGGDPNAGMVPPSQQIPTLYSANSFRSAVRDGTISSSASIPYRFVRYPDPSGATNSGFYVGHVGTPGALVDIVSYGWHNGAVRRVRGTGHSFSIFDWAAIWALNPNTGSWAWKFSGNARIVGASGADGVLQMAPGANVTWYDGPVFWAGAGAASNPAPPVYPSGANIPTGHPGTTDHVHALASPPVKYLARPIGFPTADDAANDWGGGSTGLEQFRSANHNATGLRYLVRNLTTSAIRELPGSYQVCTDLRLDGEIKPSAGTLSGLGMAADEEYYGVRVYPGNYFFESVSMANLDRLSLRTFTDAERGVVPQSITVQGDPPNPNSGQAGNANIRFWIGRHLSGQAPNSTFTHQTEMEYPRYASRFRVYAATRGTVTVKGTNADPPPPFRVNLLAYNRDANGPYGDVQFQSSVYLFGSLIGWQVTVTGGTTIEKEVPELGPGDTLTYMMDTWREIP